MKTLPHCRHCDSKILLYKDVAVVYKGLPQKVVKLIKEGKIRAFQCVKCKEWYLISDDQQVFYYYVGWKPWQPKGEFVFR